MTAGIVDKLLDELRTEEKLRLVRGGVDPAGRATGYVPPIERLGIPSCAFSDGPLGVRAGESTAFPASIALASTWDPELAERFGAALAAEARVKGFEGVLAPGLNIIRVPQCGRIFEYYSEDPHLTTRIATATVSGIESQNVLSTPKHYLANNQETDRLSVSTEVGERALRELYLPATAAAVEEGGAGVVMTAYNRVNGTYMSEHRRLLTDLLKDELGFEGVVMSDWWAVRDGAAAAAAGLDLEMPGVALSDLFVKDGRLVRPRAFARRWPIWLPSSFDDAVGAILGASTEGPGFTEMLRSPFARSLPRALDRGDLPEARLDDMVRRLLRQYERIGLLDADTSLGSQDDEGCKTKARRVLARKIAVRGTVLLKNAEEVLPLDSVGLDAVAVLGPHADAAKTGGGGSSAVTPEQTVSPLSGIRERVGSSVRVDFERGVESSRRSSVASRAACPLLGRLARTKRAWYGDRSDRLNDAVRAAENAGIAIVVVADHASEGRDRSLSLPDEQDRLIRAVAATETPTIVVLATAGPVEMPWLDDSAAVLQTWYPGQEAGGALAAVLFGDSDPGGRLPITFGRAAGDYPAKTRAQYPGVEGRAGYREAAYSEGIFVGYRHFDAAGVEPLFPFGHGRSYAAFDYRDLAVDSAGEAPARAEVTIENVGERTGREVVQAYVASEGGRLERPPRELAGFAPLTLAPGETKTVEFSLSERAFMSYDETAGEWIIDAATFTVEVGRSSHDRRLAAGVEPND